MPERDRRHRSPHMRDRRPKSESSRGHPRGPEIHVSPITPEVRDVNKLRKATLISYLTSGAILYSKSYSTHHIELLNSYGKDFLGPLLAMYALGPLHSWMP